GLRRHRPRAGRRRGPGARVRTHGRRTSRRRDARGAWCARTRAARAGAVAMAQAATFERFFERAPEPPTREVRPARNQSWRSWESWLTLSLVLLVQLPVVGSL